VTHSLDQEQEWARQLREARVRLVERVRAASCLSSPSRRMALYQQWRTEIGDNAARESAKYAEAVVGGRRQLWELERML